MTSTSSQGLRMFDPAQPRSRVFLPAILSGLLLYLAYFPANIGVLAWITLVPMLSLVGANARTRRVFAAAFVGGLFCYVPAIQWIRVAHPAMYASWAFLSLYSSFTLAVSICLVRRLVRGGTPLWLATPFVWVGAEYFRAHFPTGFTWMELIGARHAVGFGWYMLGHTQHDLLGIIQIADIGGVYAVTFLVALVNAAILENLAWRAGVRRWLRWPSNPPDRSRVGALVALGLLIATIGYGSITASAPKETKTGPQVALIQGNLPQDVKNEAGRQMEKHFGGLADEAAFPLPGEPLPDLIVWPETSFAYPWSDAQAGANLNQAPLDFQRHYQNVRHYVLAEQWGRKVPALIGANTEQWETDSKLWRYNSAILIGPKGQLVERYDKYHLVPFGEYVPMVTTFPFLKAFTPYEGDYSCRPGERFTRFPLEAGGRTYHFGCLICYEDSDPTLAREYVRPGTEAVDFLVNISNDGWFNGTEEHEQHLAICRFRAIETRRSVVRAVNMGISGVIDPRGNIVALPGETWSASKKVEAVVRAAVPLGTGTTLYARFGDWLPLLAWGVVIVGTIRGRRRPTA